MASFFSKANLMVWLLASRDPLERALHGVRFEPDGSTAAGNGRVVMAVSPADARAANFPARACDPMSVPEDGLVMPPDVVVRVLGQMAKDKRLQYVCTSQVPDPNRVGFTTVNEKGDPTEHAAVPTRTVFADWRAFFRGFFVRERVKVCINRSDLVDLLKAMEAACPDKGGINPAFIEVDVGGKSMVVRCSNFETGQRALGAINAYDTKGRWHEMDAWEMSVCSEAAVVLKKKIPVRRK
jgi:hypothetical protein